MLQSSPSETLRLRGVSGRALAVPVAAGSELLGALMVSAAQPWHDHGDELLRAIAHQIAVALEKTELIESLSEEGIARELFAALQEDRIDVAHARARKLGADLERPHVVLEARPLSPPAFADGADARLERSLRQAVPGTICDADGRRVRALVPGATPARWSGCSGPSPASTASRSARARCAAAPPTPAPRWPRPPTPPSSACACSRTAASCPTRTWAPTATWSGRCATAGRRIRCARRSTGWRRTTASAAPQLLLTLERYLENGRSLTTSARELTVHVNTLRQRLDRIESLTGLDLAAEDLLALQLAIKLALLRRHPAPPR